MKSFRMTRYAGQIARLVARKKEQVLEKQRKLGKADEDDYGYVLPPEDFMKNFHFPEVNENGSFYGVRAWAKNFRALMEAHPVYVDPDDALAGRWMFMISRMRAGYRLSLAPFPADYSFLHRDQERYDLTHGIGKDAHFAPDYRIGLALGWGGLTDKVRKSLKRLAKDEEAAELLQAELDVLAGIRNWIHRTALAAEGEVRRINLKLETEAPETLQEACQWIAWFNMASRTYNRDGAGGQLDEILRPYYERDIAAGRIDDEDAVYFIACLLLNDPHYYQIGGPDREGNDQTSRISYLILEAAHLLKISCNLTIRVHDRMEEGLFRRGVEILLEDRLGYPRFSGDNALIRGYMRNGYSAEQARERIALGCNWMSIPGREYTLNDVVKINLMKVFEVAFQKYRSFAVGYALGLFSLGALREHSHANGLASAFRHHDCTANSLIGLAGINAELNGNVHGFVKLGIGASLDSVQSIVQSERLGEIVLGRNGLHALGNLCHDYRPSTVMPMERAEPAIVRTAASRSAAVRSVSFILSISSACALVILPTLSVCGRAEPLVIFAAFLMRMVAGGVFITKVKDLSA